VAVLALTAAVAAQPARPNEITESLQAGSALVQSLADPTPTTAVTTAAVAPPPATNPSIPAETTAPTETTAPAVPDTVPAETTAGAPAETTPPPAPGVPRIVALGDSVMLGAAGALDGRFGADIAIDAVVSRQFTDGIGILQALRDQGRLPQVLVVHLGNNGNVSAEVFDQLMAVVAGVPTVAFVNIRNNRSWESSVNQTLADGVARYPNARLVDWYGFSSGQPNLFYKDGIHLRPEGAARYAELVAGVTS
jgi:lysophospholipase L1-like esterase